MSVAEVFTAALQLPKDRRIALREALDESIAEEADEALDAELERRWQGYLSGERPGIPAEEVYRQLRAEFRKPA